MSPADFKLVPHLLAAVAIYTCGSAVMDARRKTDRIGGWIGIASALMMVTANSDWLTPILGINIWTAMNVCIIVGFWVIAYRRIWGDRNP